MNELITKVFIGQPRLHRVCQLFFGHFELFCNRYRNSVVFSVQHPEISRVSGSEQATHFRQFSNSYTLDPPTYTCTYTLQALGLRVNLCATYC